MTVAQRLYMLIFVFVVGMAGLSGLGMVQLESVYIKANYSNINTVPSLQALSEAIEQTARLRIQLWQYISVREPADRSVLVDKLSTARTKIAEALNLYEKEHVSDNKDKALMAADRAALADYDRVREKVLTLTNSGKPDEARDFLFANQLVLRRLEGSFEEHRLYNVELGKQGAEEASTALRNGNRLSIVLSLLIIAVTVGLGVTLVRKIVGALNEALQIAQTVATGDLTSDIEVKSKDETGKLLQALKEMNDSLVNMVGEVRGVSDTIATASSQIAQGNLDLSSRTEEQASSLEETASSMEEMTSTVKQNADNARHANQLALSASEAAVKGQQVVSQVIDTMGSINASSQKIADIIGVIDGIAFQTNILALNAAVEAARAGEQGRGFAVVATEVRNLAQRSATAAKEIKALIVDSVETVDFGSKLVNEAGTTMQIIVDSIKSVTGIMGEITLASQEQTSGIEQINQAIMQMDQTTQQNAALVEEAAAAAESLQEQAGSLVQVVSVFKMQDNPVAAPVLRKREPAARPHVAGSNRPTSKASFKAMLANSGRRSAASEEWEQF